MNNTTALECVALIEGSFGRYKDNGAVAVSRWLERSSYSKADIESVIDALTEAGEKWPPKPAVILAALRELDRIPHAAPGYGDPRLLAEHTKSIREQALQIARIRACTFREAVEAIRDEQQAWLDEGVRMDYMPAADRGWHRDRVTACARVLAGEEGAA